MSVGLTAAQFQKKLLAWYQAHQRALPWRETKDPYLIWVSEIILQQTRVAQGLPYYQRFTEAFPTVSSLANAKEQQVLRLWQGLGYYSRARNMHRCAKKIVSDHQSKFPSSYDQLLGLPGIGPYTAAAISSIAFGERAAVVDGNVYRVLSRIYGIDVDITSVEGKKSFAAKANELISEQSPGDFNQAMMEFGATHCTPKNPNCSECPFAKTCVALATDRIAELPVKLKKQKVRVRHLHYFLIQHNNKIALRQRLDKDIWTGLFDFYLVETKKATTTEKILAADSTLRSLNGNFEDGPYQVKHILSHQELTSNSIFEITGGQKTEA
jgi:A/G-specific adenine glycosylase